MNNLNLLVVEGNLQKENETFKKSGIPTHAESLRESLSYYSSNLNIDVFNPCSESSFEKILPNIKKYDGLIWGGSSLNIYNDCIEIRRQISFMKECFKNIKKILAICWGMQVAVTAAGGEVKKSPKGAHIGIAKDIEIKSNQDKNKIFECLLAYLPHGSLKYGEFFKKTYLFKKFYLFFFTNFMSNFSCSNI